jgi:hypothetical protein
MRRNWLRLICVALSIGATFTLGSSVLRADLVGHWTFDGTLEDASVNGNDGTFMGAPLPMFSSDVPAVIGAGQSISLAGGNAHVLVADNPSLDIIGAMTISAWVKPVGNVGWDGIVAKSPSSNGSAAGHAGNYELRIESGGRRLQFLHQAGGVDDTRGYTSPSVAANNAWQHIAVTVVNGGAAQFYLNGAPAGSFAVNGLFGATNDNPLYIGNRGDFTTTPMDGLIDELRIYDNALSPLDVFLLANPGVDPGEPYPMIASARARASSFFTGDGRTPAGAVNGSGLVGRLHIANSPGGNMWLSAENDVNPTFDIDLGGVHTVDDLRIWNYNENANATCCLGRGVALADVYVAGADGVFGASPILTGVELDPAPGTLSDFSQVVSLGGTQARYVRLAVTANHGDASFTGLSEVKVTGSAVAGQAPLPTTVASVSSNLAGFDRNAAYAVNGAGRLYGDAQSIVPDGTMWLSQGTFGADPLIHDLAPEITFDLGSEQVIDSMKVWNYNEYRADLPERIAELLGRGVALANVLIAGEDMNFTTLYEFLELDRAPEGGDAADFGQLVDMQGMTARFVKFEILANHNGKDFLNPLSDDGLANFVGLSEVQFFGVPEPSTYALAFVGLATLACIRRRRRAA